MLYKYTPSKKGDSVRILYTSPCDKNLKEVNGMEDVKNIDFTQQ